MLHFDMDDAILTSNSRLSSDMLCSECSFRSLHVIDFGTTRVPTVLYV